MYGDVLIYYLIKSEMPIKVLRSLKGNNPTVMFCVIEDFHQFKSFRFILPLLKVPGTYSLLSVLVST